MSALEAIARIRQQPGLVSLFDQPLWACSGGTNAAGKPDKAPRDYRAPWKHAKSNDPTTWGTLDQIETAARKYPRHIHHVGIISGPSARVLDWDHKPHAEQPLSVSTQAMLFSHCYQEISLSGRGLRCLILAPDLDFKKRSFDVEPGVELEVFASHQYAILTGNTTNPAPIREASQELADLMALLEPVVAPTAPTTYAPRPRLAYNGDSRADLYEATDRAYNLHDYLESQGYTRAPGNRHLYPQSETGAPGVVVERKEDGRLRCWSNHRSDPLGNKHWNDVFDVICLLEYGGDHKQAAAALRESLGLQQPQRAPTLVTPLLTLEDAKANWAAHGDDLISKMLEALSHTNMHHHARTSLADLLANIYYRASEGELQQIGPHLCVMVGGMNQLAAELGGRPNDASARLKLAASHGFLRTVAHSDAEDPRSSLLIAVPADPLSLPFLSYTREELHSLILRPTTRETRRPTRKLFTPPVDTHSKATPTGGVNRKSPKNPLQDAWRVALTLSRTPGLSLKEVGKLARCRQDTLRRHLATLEAAGLAKGTRLLVTFREVFAAMHAAVKERTEQRMAAFMRHAQQYARWELGLARLGSAAARRVAPARRRLLKRAEGYLGLTPPQGSYAHTLRMSA